MLKNPSSVMLNIGIRYNFESSFDKNPNLAEFLNLKP